MKPNFNINLYVDKIFYINLDRDKLRNQNMLDQFQKYNIYNFERFPGILIDDISKYKHKMLGPYHGVKDVEHYLKGSIGCLLAHKGIIELAKKRGYKKILILEDDVTFHQNFNQMCQKYLSAMYDTGKYWNMIYLGLDDWKNCISNIKINEDVYRLIGGGYGAHAYILHYNIYDYVLTNIDYLKIEIDLIYNTLSNLKGTHSYVFAKNLIYKEDKFISNIRKYK